RRAGDPPKLIAQADRARAELGWRPAHDLRSMVEAACASSKATEAPRPPHRPSLPGHFALMPGTHRNHLDEMKIGGHIPSEWVGGGHGHVRADKTLPAFLDTSLRPPPGGRPRLCRHGPLIVRRRLLRSRPRPRARGSRLHA